MHCIFNVVYGVYNSWVQNELDFIKKIFRLLRKLLQSSCGLTYFQVQVSTSTISTCTNFIAIGIKLVLVEIGYAVLTSTNFA